MKKVAIIGCGTMGRMHAAMASAAGLEVAACVDADMEQAEALALANPGATPTDDVQSILSRDALDIVAVCTPPATHLEYIQKAAAAGKHIFCEKPLCRTVEDCDAAIEAADNAGVKLFVGQVVRYFQEFDQLYQSAQSGRIGDIGFVKTFRGGIFPQGSQSWYQDYERSGGAVFDLSIHDFDWIRYLLGDPERLFCQTLQRPDGIDYSLTTLRMKSGQIAHCIASWAHPQGFRVKVEICGDQGMLAFDSEETPISHMRREEEESSLGLVVPSSPVEVSPYELEWRDFRRWIEEGAAPRTTAEDGKWAVRMGEAALESAKSRKAVSFK